MTSEAESRFLSILVLGISLIGIGLRIYFYALNRSLSIDEAMLAATFVNRSFIHQLWTLEYRQAAPLGFLFLERALITLVGNRDYIIKLIPLVAGIASVPLMYAVAKRYCKGIAPLVAVGLFSLSPNLIYMSSVVKQYSSDVLVTLLLLFVAAKYIVDDKDPRSLKSLCIAGALAIWMSHSSMFILAGILFTLALAGLRERDFRKIRQLTGIGFLWLINLAVLYAISLRYFSSDMSANPYWSVGFMPLPPWRNLHWFYDAFGGLFHIVGSLPMGFPRNIVPLVLFLLGGYSFLYRKWRSAIVLTTPFLFLLFASALHSYPFTDRALLFSISPLLLLVAEGTERLRSVLGRLNKPIAVSGSVLLCGFLLYQPTKSAYANVQSPNQGEDIKPVMAYLSKNRKNRDLIYVSYFATPAFEYYASLYGFNRRDYIPSDVPDESFGDLDALRGNDRVWVLFSHGCSSCEWSEDNYLRHLGDLGSITNEFKSSNVTIYLYDMAGVRRR
jgi:hypothetical protein